MSYHRPIKILSWSLIAAAAGAAAVSYHIAFAQVANQKYDGDCSPAATVGRCADKPLLPATTQPAVIPATVPGFAGK